MINEEKLFGNFLNSHLITSQRLFLFGDDSLQRFIAANGGGDYQDIIDLLTPNVSALGLETGQLDTAINIGRGRALANKQVMAAFILTMRNKEGTISDLLGGRNTPAYLEFYPHGLTEYNTATKAQMSILVNRVKTAATAHSAALGVTLTALLTGFQLSWTTSRESQIQQKGVVDENRNERTGARIELEPALLTAVHSIAAKFPGDISACSSFFDFQLLFNHTHHTSFEHVDVLGPNAFSIAANKTLTDNDKLYIKNTDDNTIIAVYLAATADAPVPENALIIKSNKGKRPKPSTLGNLNNTFLIIKNISTVNNGSYLVKIKGVSGGEGE